MLMLTVNERGFVQIGDNIRVYVSKIQNGHQVSLGIEAPPEVTILRDKVIARNEAKGNR